MANVGISYAHVDAAAAIALRRMVIEHGLSVWMDEPDESSEHAESIGLPSGQSHWDVITSEFAKVDLIVVIDTGAWRASRYCQAEYQFVLEWGKWVEVVRIEDDGTFDRARITELITWVGARQPVTGAHTRLVRSARAGGPGHVSRSERLLHRGEERDAHVVLATSPETSGITVTEPVRRYADDALRRSRRARKRLRRIAVSATAVLAVLAVVGVAAMFVAGKAERSATESAARSHALDLADRSSVEDDTTKALALARDAKSIWPSRDATDAVNVATARDDRLRTIVVGPEAYLGAVWAAAAPTIVVYTDHRLVALNADTGEQLRSIDLDTGLRLGTVAVSHDGKLAAFVTPSEDGKRMRIADLGSGDVRDTDIENVHTVVTGDGKQLWWSDAVGLHRGSFGDLAKESIRSYPLTLPVLAVDVSPNRSLVDYIDARGVLHTATYDENALTEASQLVIVPQDDEKTQGGPSRSSVGEPISSVAGISSSDKALPASLRRCGGNLFGGIVGRSALKGTSFSVVDGGLQVSGQFGSPQTPVCSGDGTAWYSSIMPGGPSHTYGNAPWLPSGAERRLAVSDPSGTRSSVITNNGRLYHLPNNAIRLRDAEGALAMLRIGNAEYLLQAEGRVVDVATGSTTGTVPARFSTRSTQTVDDFGVVATHEMLWRINSNGQVSPLLPLKDADIRALRGGSDGETFVGALPDGLILIDPAVGETSSVTIDELGAGETPVDADISPSGDALSFVTDAGRVGTITLSSGKPIAAAQFASENVMPGSLTRLAYVPDTGGLVVLSGDGAVRLLDTDLKVTETAFYGGRAERLSADGRWIRVSSEALGTTIFDGLNLSLQDRLPRSVFDLDPRTVTLDAAGRRLVGLDVPNTGTGEGSTYYEIPLPTL